MPEETPAATGGAAESASASTAPAAQTAEAPDSAATAPAAEPDAGATKEGGEAPNAPAPEAATEISVDPGLFRRAILAGLGDRVERLLVAGGEGALQEVVELAESQAERTPDAGQGDSKEPEGAKPPEVPAWDWGGLTEAERSMIDDGIVKSMGALPKHVQAVVEHFTKPLQQQLQQVTQAHQVFLAQQNAREADEWFNAQEGMDKVFGKLCQVIAALVNFIQMAQSVFYVVFYQIFREFGGFFVADFSGNPLYVF